MGSFYVVKEQKAADFLIETEAWEGVRRIAETVSEDIEAVSGCKMLQKSKLDDCTGGRVVLVATVGKSPILLQLESEGKLTLEGVHERREVYLQQIIDQPFSAYPDVKQLLVIAGSDKRGTIYGMFRLSERCGVSPLIFFGDAAPDKQPEPVITLAEPYVSKEPSVKYRGFFINDEWPAFGNWCMERFGGVNQKAYQVIFELLLRLKGNYLWPAMWRSSFSEDGPGLASAELADIYGVIMGTSHHEPLCRAGVEWQNQYRKYGTDSTWSLPANKEAITRFWEDGVLRNKSFENLITIGMRGENDSRLLPEDAALRDNIEVIKSAIRAQHRILREHLDSDLKKVPRLLAIYKEVEDYYFGDESCDGLAGWEELADVIFLLSDDNYGNLRSLPTKESRSHPGGYGMYYHFDYHGAPVSYEWVNCSCLSKIWEQMTQAYESGVRELWIVNVGDIKGMEYPLSYFLELAYDYDSWGSMAPNHTEAFTRLWIDRQFGQRLTDGQKEMMAEVLEGYSRWNAVRSPEAMREGIYHPIHFSESDRVWKQVHKLMETANRLNAELTGETLTIYQSMIYYPAAASLNLILMYLEAGINKELAGRGCVYANVYADCVLKRIHDDSRYIEEYHSANGRKWDHCMSSAHTGFRSWDDNDWTYPTVEKVTPIPGGKAVVSFRGSDQYHLGAHWQDREPLTNDDFLRPDTNEVLVDLDSRGDVSFSYEVEFECPWLQCFEKSGRVVIEDGGRENLRFSVNRRLLQGREEASVTIRIMFDNGQKTHSRLLFAADTAVISRGEKTGKLFLVQNGYCAIAAEHFSENRDIEGKGFRVISGLGREGAAIKSFPEMEYWTDAAQAPYVKYSLLAEREGLYKLRFYLSARNPVCKGGRMRFAVSANDDAPQTLYAVSEQYYTEWFNTEWANGVLNHVRIVTAELSLREGENDIFVYAGDPGVILEKLVLYSADRELPDSYLGPPGSSECSKCDNNTAALSD